jgi:hypothetical protein
MRVGEPGSRFRLQLVAGEVLRLEGDGVCEVRLEIGGALARNAVDEIERDVVETGITKSVHCPPDVVRTGNAFQRLQEVRPERLRADGDTGDAVPPEEFRQLGRDGLRVGLDGQLVDTGKRAEHTGERRRLREGRRPPAHEDGLDASREAPALLLELGEECVRIRAMLLPPADGRHEVAVPAPVDAEREMDVEVPDTAGHLERRPGGSKKRRRVGRGDGRHRYRFLSPSRLSTARNASCGTSTPPTCFIRFLPFFCFSRSFRLRVMSPP